VNNVPDTTVADDPDQLRLANRRLVWEQTLINEVGNDLRHLQEPEHLIARVLNRLMKRLGVESSAARLLNPESGVYDLCVVSAPEDVRRAWDAVPPLAPRPSDRVLAMRAPVALSSMVRSE